MRVRVHVCVNERWCVCAFFPFFLHVLFVCVFVVKRLHTQSRDTTYAYNRTHKLPTCIMFYARTYTHTHRHTYYMLSPLSLLRDWRIK